MRTVSSSAWTRFCMPGSNVNAVMEDGPGSVQTNNVVRTLRTHCISSALVALIPARSHHAVQSIGVERGRGSLDQPLFVCRRRYALGVLHDQDEQDNVLYTGIIDTLSGLPHTLIDQRTVSSRSIRSAMSEPVVPNYDMRGVSCLIDTNRGSSTYDEGLLQSLLTIGPG